MKNIAIFASGTGSNARAIAQYFDGSENVEVALVVSNVATAKVLDMNAEMGIATYVIPSKEAYLQGDDLLDVLDFYEIDLIVLAGFLWLIPPYLVAKYKIVNIHPALLPSYGGKGMYGMRVHQAVIDNKETQSGITIHWVNEEYDKGAIIHQATVAVEPTDTAATLAQKIHTLEHLHYPQQLEKLLLG